MTKDIENYRAKMKMFVNIFCYECNWILASNEAYNTVWCHNRECHQYQLEYEYPIIEVDLKLNSNSKKLKELLNPALRLRGSNEGM